MKNEINGMRLSRYIASTLLTNSKLNGKAYFEKEDQYTQTIEKCLAEFLEEKESAYTIKDLYDYGYSMDFIIKVWNLPNDTKYLVTRDLQDGTFGMYRVYGVRDWVCQALEWCYMDGFEEEPTFLLQSPMDTIADYWQLHFERADNLVEYYNNRRGTDVKINDLNSNNKLFDKVIDEFYRIG